MPSLSAYLAQSPEERAARGRRRPLLALRLLVSVATRCGARSQTAIAAWGQDHGQPWLRRLGFTGDRAPRQSTFRRLFGRLAHRTVEAAARQWAEQARRRCAPAAGALAGGALEGQPLRGGQRRGAADAHLLAACSHRPGVVLGPLGVPDTTSASGAAASGAGLTLALVGRVVTADALLTQRAVARTLLAGGGDDLLAVKANQPALLGDIAAAFAPGADDTGPVGAAGTSTQHGGRVEPRHLVASTAPVGYSDWPGPQQAVRLERRVLAKRTGTLLRQGGAYAVTSLRPARATPAPSLARWRGHWSSEDRRHHLRDVTFDADRATVRAHHAPQVMAAFRTAASGLLPCRGTTRSAATCRRFAAQPRAALAAVGLTPDFA